MKRVRVADFTTLPGPRYIADGKNSGEEFRDKVLVPAYDEARKSDETLEVDLDGVEFGYPASFLEESFGGLARLRSIEEVQKRLCFASADEPGLEREIRK